MSGWRKRQIRDLKDQNYNELWTIHWTQPYDTSSLSELMTEILLDDEFKEANEIIKLIKSKL